ncbi:NB-ARC domain-containing protein [Streptomyces yangpuensis]|uniref:WD40 domain-containing protein n=1 Tax=Streptomyces yangpuensis TaxID=1648182 RepID=UPI0034212DAA
MKRIRGLGAAVGTALCVCAVGWLILTAVRDGWGEADPVASVFGGAAGLLALSLAIAAQYGSTRSTRGTAASQSVPPDVPDWVVGRDEIDRVVAAVTLGPRRLRALRREAGDQRSVGITTGLQGSGGFGKTVLALVVRAHPKVRGHFHDRIYHVTIGRDVRGSVAVAAKVAELIHTITGAVVDVGQDPRQAGDHLARLLAGLPRTLLVIDDVWDHEQLEPFLRGGHDGCVRLITTRNPTVLPSDTVRVDVDRMSAEQARAVLVHRLDPPPSPEAVVDLVEATGRWALLLRIVHQFIATQAATGVDATEAARTVLARLRERGPAGEDPDGPWDLGDPYRRNKAVQASIEAATTLLPAGASRRFVELGIFAEDEEVPLPLVVCLWRATGGLDEADARALCVQMANLSLVTVDTAAPGGTLSVHDVVRDYQRTELGDGLRALNGVFLNALGATLPRTAAGSTAWWETTDSYLLDHLISHLLGAGHEREARNLTRRFEWIRARLHQRGPSAPWSDLYLADDVDSLGFARRLAGAAHLLSPTDPAHALDAVLLSRVPVAAESNPAGLLPTTVHAMVNRWSPPDLPDPALLRTLPGHPAGTQSVAFSPDGTRLAVSSYHSVHIWDVGSGAVLQSLPDQRYQIQNLVLGSDGVTLTTVTETGRVGTWDIRSGSLRRVLPGEVSAPGCVGFSTDGSRCAAVDPKGQVQVWDTVADRLTSVLRGHDPQELMAFNMDGTRIATFDARSNVIIWDVDEGRLLMALETPLVRDVVFCPNGDLFATTGPDEHVRLWTVGEDIPRHVLPGYGNVWNVAFDQGGILLAVATSDEKVRIWHTPSASLLHTLPAHPGRPLCLTFSPDGALLVTTGTDASVHLWKMEAGTLLRTLTGPNGGVHSVVFSPDGTLFATAGSDESIRIWSTADASLSATPSAGNGIQALSFSPDGTLIATAGADDHVRIWDAADGTFLRSVPHEQGSRRAVVLDAPDVSIAGGSHPWTWDVPAQRPVRSVWERGTSTVDTAYSPDGTLVATIDADNTIQITRATDGALLTIMRTDSPLRSCCWSPDGTVLAAGGDRGLFCYDVVIPSVPQG